MNRWYADLITRHHETLKLVVAAVKDLQNATGMLVERIGVAVDRLDADDWWKGDGGE